jgi:hypothetical protein
MSFDRATIFLFFFIEVGREVVVAVVVVRKCRPLLDGLKKRRKSSFYTSFLHYIVITVCASLDKSVYHAMA